MRIRTSIPWRWFWLIASCWAAAPAFGCPGDCDGNGRVSIGEIVTYVRIGLGAGALSPCPSLDGDENRVVTIADMIAAVAASLNGCPTPTPTLTDTPSPTATDTSTPSPTPTATPDHPPQLVCMDPYRSFPNFPIEFALPVNDPDGDALQFSSDAVPNGAELDESTGVFRWTPRQGDVGTYFVPFTADDGGPYPESVTGLLVLEILPLDGCTLPVCDPATGCTRDFPSLDVLCCLRPGPRLAEPDLGCPASRAVHIGRNRDMTFGRVRNCDILPMRNFSQSGAQIDVNVEARCIDNSGLVDVHLRVETATRLAFDETQTTFIATQPDGWARIFLLQYPVIGPGPFFEFEGQEALVTVELTDSSGMTLREQLRPVLTFDPQPPLSDPAPFEPPITPDACVSPTSTASATGTPTATATPTPTASATATPTDTTVATPTESATATATNTAIATATESAPATATDTALATTTATATPTGSEVTSELPVR